MRLQLRLHRLSGLDRQCRAAHQLIQGNFKGENAPMGAPHLRRTSHPTRFNGNVVTKPNGKSSCWMPMTEAACCNREEAVCSMVDPDGIPHSHGQSSPLRAHRRRQGQLQGSSGHSWVRITWPNLLYPVQTYLVLRATLAENMAGTLPEPEKSRRTAALWPRPRPTFGMVFFRKVSEGPNSPLNYGMMRYGPSRLRSCSSIRSRHCDDFLPY